MRFLTSVNPNTHGMSGIHASTGRTLSNIKPSTIPSFIHIAFTLHVPLGTTPPRFPRSTSAHHFGHIHPCAFLHPIVLFLPLSLQTISTLLSGPCLRSCLRHIQCPNDSIVHRFLSFNDIPRIICTIIATIYQHSVNAAIIYFSFLFQRDTPFCQNWC